MLFAQDQPIDQLLTIIKYIVVFVSGGGLLKLADYLMKSRSQTRADKAVADKTAIDYFKDLVERTQKNLDELETEYRAVVTSLEQERADKTQVLIKMARMEMYLESLEERLDIKNEHYRKWRDTPGTQPPSPTPPPQPKGNGSSMHLPKVPQPTPPPPKEDSDIGGAV